MMKIRGIPSEGVDAANSGALKVVEGEEWRRFGEEKTVWTQTENRG